MPVNANNRNLVIDILRALATLLVILAHVDIPDALALARSFDVCLLVLVSGYIFSQRHRENMNYGSYLMKRIKRLCVPAYITASFIFLICIPLCLIAKRDYPYTWVQILETFTFVGGRTGGIGYFWIVRIYLLMALIAPLLKAIDKKIRSSIAIFGIALGALALSQLIYILTWNKFGAVYDAILENLIMSTLAYGSIYLIGIRMQSKRDFKFIAFVGFLVMCAALVIVKFVIFEQKYIVANFKYPPQAEYVVISMTLALLVWLVVEFFFSHLQSARPVVWFSKQSFNIYLVHIAVLMLMSWGNKLLSKIPLINLWFIRFPIILTISVGAVVAIDCLIKLIKKRVKS